MEEACEQAGLGSKVQVKLAAQRPATLHQVVSVIRLDQAAGQRPHRFQPPARVPVSSQAATRRAEPGLPAEGRLDGGSPNLQ